MRSASTRTTRGEARTARLARRREDVEALRRLRPPRRAHRRGRPGRDEAPVVAELDRPGDDARSRSGDEPVDGEPGVLRAVRARPDRLDRSCRRRAGVLTPRSSRSICRCSSIPGSSSSRCCLSDLGAVLLEVARERAPYKVTNWVRRLASDFHGFYHDCRVIGEGVPPELSAARLWLVEAVRIGLAIGLSLLGVAAPEEM